MNSLQKKMFTLTFLFNIVFFANSLFAHPVHLTVTNIEYNTNDKKFDITIRLFVDDFEKILDTKYNTKLNLFKQNEAKNADFYIQNYITQNLKLKINGNFINEKKFILEKRSQEDITIWLTFSVKYKQRIHSIEITNKLMTDLYRDQKNMLIFTYQSKQSALEFNYKNTKKTINI